MEFDAMRDYLLAVGDEPDVYWIGPFTLDTPMKSGRLVDLIGPDTADEIARHWFGDSEEDANAE